MSSKIAAGVALLVLLASTGLASAQTARHYVQEPYTGTIWQGVVPYGSDQVPDPYAGTIWQGVTPY